MRRAMNDSREALRLCKRTSFQRFFLLDSLENSLGSEKNFVDDRAVAQKIG